MSPINATGVNPDRTPDRSGPEERILNVIAKVSELMGEAAQAAAEIGPEWENVVEELQLTITEELEQLKHRVADRQRRPKVS